MLNYFDLNSIATNEKNICHLYQTFLNQESIKSSQIKMLLEESLL